MVTYPTRIQADRNASQYGLPWSHWQKKKKANHILALRALPRNRHVLLPLLFDWLKQVTWSCACMLSHFSRVWLLKTPWTIAFQAPLSMEFSRQEYWNGLLCPPLGDLPSPGVELVSSPALASGFFTTSTTWWGKEVLFYHIPRGRPDNLWWKALIIGTLLWNIPVKICWMQI